MKDKIITAVLSVIMILNFVDVISDIRFGAPTWHIVEESMIVLASAIAVVYLLMDMRNRTRELNTLAATLDNADRELANITQEMKKARREYSGVIHQQFDAWKLTKGEQQVALLLLKGLSFKEIAIVRSTQEKTVRQQASTIYGKSGVEGRHAFAAWFLEDFMQAKESVTDSTLI